MVNKICFLFGHSDTPDTILPLLRNAIETSIQGSGVRTFVVGHYGEFDRLTRVTLLQLKQKYPEIRLYMLIPYHPADRPVQTPEGFEGTCYPPLEGVPKRYAPTWKIQTKHNHRSVAAIAVLRWLFGYG